MRCIGNVDPRLTGAFTESNVAVVRRLVYEKLIGRFVVANVDIEISIVIHIHQRDAGRPRITTVDILTDQIGNVLELKVFLGLKIDRVSARSIRQKKIWPIIIVQITCG